MRKLIWFFTALLAALGFANAEALQDKQVQLFTADRIFDLEYASDPQMSPNGETVVYVRNSMGRSSDNVEKHLWAIDTRSGEHHPIIADHSAWAARWSPSGDRIVYLTAQNDSFQLWIRNIDTGVGFKVTEFDRALGTPVWSPDGKQIAFTKFVPRARANFTSIPPKPRSAEWAKPAYVIDDLLYRFDGRGYLEKGATHVFIVSAEGGTARQVTSGRSNFNSPVWLDDDTLIVTGNMAADAELDPLESEIYRVELDNLSVEALTTRDGPDGEPVVSADRRLIAFTGFDDQLKIYQDNNIYVMNADGSGVRNLTENYDRSPKAIAWRGGEIVGQVEVDGELHLVSFDMNGRVKTLVRDLGGRLRNGRPYAKGGFSVSRLTRDIAYTSSNDGGPAEVGLLEGRKKRKLSNLNEDVLSHLTKAQIEKIEVTSSHDGRKIDAWIARPADFEADGSHPMILEIHGGPFAMYGNFFSTHVQRFVAEGYVVVYANPRGSTGYGEDFAQLVQSAAPDHDYDDLMSVVDAVVERNYVDPKRLFVTGQSYGGALTAWIAGKTDRFAAAVSIKPVINWTTTVLSGDLGAFASRHMFHAQPWEDPELYWRRSPLSLAGNIKTPTMLIVGEQDWRTPAWEAEQLYSALKLRQIETALVRLPGTSHVTRRPSRLMDETDNILGWFAKYNPAPHNAQ